MSALPQQLERVIFALCEDTDTPRALTVYLLVKNREYGQLVALTTDPGHYSSPDRYFLDVTVSELLRKYSGFVIPGIDKAAVALENFYSSEQACAVTNARLSKYLTNGPFEDLNEVRLIESIDRMKNWIATCLGRLPQWETFFPRFGPGATFRDVGKYTTVPDKISARPTMTSLCSLLLPLWERTAWASALVESNPCQSHPEYVRGNRFTTVPKDAKKDRGIAIEPSLNVYFQLGVGDVLKRRLLRAGLDLQNGQDIHRRVACEASSRGHCSTIDLSNASDTVSQKLVELLLPKEWFDLLDTLRSPMTFVDGKWFHLSKFSSMGNGYTFELETLIFSAIALEACYLSGIDASPGTDLWVYGDDIILPSQASATMLTLLRFFGFTPNSGKTFTSGPFRESCGGDFFSGRAVRPHYLKDEPHEPAEWIALANGIRRLGRKDFVGDFRWGIVRRAWLRALDAIPVHIRRLRGPEDLGDLVIHDEREFWRRRRTRDQRTFIKTWMPFMKALPLHNWKGPVVYACALYGIPSDGVLARGSVAGFREKWVSYPE
jgi:hypothetical protein